MPCRVQSLITLFLFSLLSLSSAYATPSTKDGELAKTEQNTTNDAGKVNINTAGVSELQNLKGIGKKRAEQIVKDREQNGPFSSPQELTRIKGIGPKTVEKNLEFITVGTSAVQNGSESKKDSAGSSQK